MARQLSPDTGTIAVHPRYDVSTARKAFYGIPKAYEILQLAIQQAANLQPQVFAHRGPPSLTRHQYHRRSPPLRCFYNLKSFLRHSRGFSDTTARSRASREASSSLKSRFQRPGRSYTSSPLLECPTPSSKSYPQAALHHPHDLPATYLLSPGIGIKNLPRVERNRSDYQHQVTYQLYRAPNDQSPTENTICASIASISCIIVSARAIAANPC